LTGGEILHCCELGYSFGFRTFVLQGGEDPQFDDGRVYRLIVEIKKLFPNCAVTLSLGERPAEVYRRWREAGADRYLLRHESANSHLFAKLHPEKQCLSSRMECLKNLRDLHFQAGTGFMVGVPYQTPEDLADDFLFLKEFHPEMVGIGPFIPHCGTPFRGEPAGSVRLTLFLLSLIRLLLPKCLLPSTTALATLSPDGRINGLRAGANVIMPNLSPEGVRRKYNLYDNKACTGLESAENYLQLTKQLADAGFRVMPERGDALDF